MAWTTFAFALLLPVTALHVAPVPPQLSGLAPGGFPTSPPALSSIPPGVFRESRLRTSSIVLQEVQEEEETPNGMINEPGYGNPPGYGVLKYGARIREEIPTLQPVMDALSPDSLREMDLLYGELTQHTGYLGDRENEAVRLALEVAYLAHMGQRRKSGEQFVTHPVQVAIILAGFRLDADSVISGLLHDTVEDTVLTFPDLEILFGKAVRRIVEGETKVSKLPKMVRSELNPTPYAQYASGGSNVQAMKRDEQAENLRSMFVAMAEDWRIVVVKLADRLHNMRTLQHMPVHKRISIARETLEIFAPLAHRLGMWTFRSELSDLAFKYLFPTEHAELEAYIDGKMRSYEAVLHDAQVELEDRLGADELLQSYEATFAIFGRTKSIHSTWKKLQRDECGVEQVNDLVALRIVICSEARPNRLSGLSEVSSPGAERLATAAQEADDAFLCYHVLGKVHGCWTPLPRTLKDYISSPKPNGYRSLHTTVLVGTQPLEVQIRTQAMHMVATHGAAAHWAYTEGKENTQVMGMPSPYDDTGQTTPGTRGAWTQIPGSTFSRAIAKWGEELECAHEFMGLVRSELLGTRVFVFTEKGRSTRILNLARGATLADAAMMLGGADLNTHTPLISGKVAPLTTELSNGDIVSFVPKGSEVPRPGSLGSAAADALGTNTVGGLAPDGVDGLVLPTTLPQTRAPGPTPPTTVKRKRDETITERPESPVDPLVPTGEDANPPPAFGDNRRVGQAYESSGTSSTGWPLLPPSKPKKYSICTRCLPLPGDPLVLAAPSTSSDRKSPAETALSKEGEFVVDNDGTLHRAETECLALRRQLASGEQLIRPTPPMQAEMSKSIQPTVLPGSYDRTVYATKVIVFTRDRPGMLLTVSAAVTAEVVNIVNVRALAGPFRPPFSLSLSSDILPFLSLSSFSRRCIRRRARLAATPPSSTACTSRTPRWSTNSSSRSSRWTTSSKSFGPTWMICCTIAWRPFGRMRRSRGEGTKAVELN